MLKWLRRHKIRLLLNIIAWGYLFMATYQNSSNYTPPPGQRAAFTLHIYLFNACYFLLVNINICWLMPRFLFRKKYLRYGLFLSGSVLLTATVMGPYCEWLLHRFPGIDTFSLSSFSFGERAKGTSWLAYILLIAPTIFLLVFVFGIGSLAQQYFEVVRQKEMIEQQQTAAELSLLKSQINPHFLFNVLNSIYALSLKKSDQAPNVVLRLSEILRYMLYEARNEMVPLEKELKMLEGYINIEKMRLTAGQALEVSLPGNIADHTIAPVLLMPFVENAIKHGTDSMAENAFINIEIKLTGSELYFHCRNNYKKRPTQEYSGIGLDNVRKRLLLLYPGRHTLTVTDKAAIFDVVLTLNLGS